MLLATAFMCWRSPSTWAATRSPSPMLVPPFAARDSTARFAAAFAIGTLLLRQDDVTVHTEFHLFFGKVEVIFLTFCPQEAVAIAVANAFTAQEIKTFWQGITLTAGEHQLTITLHGAKAATQRLKVFFFLQIHLFSPLFAAGRFFTVF